MLLNILSYLAHNLIFFTGTYSINAFPEQLPKDIEDEYIKRMHKGDKEARNKPYNLRTLIASLNLVLVL